MYRIEGITEFRELVELTAVESLSCWDVIETKWPTPWSRPHLVLYGPPGHPFDVPPKHAMLRVSFNPCMTHGA
jgi:hypothetical protein